MCSHIASPVMLNKIDSKEQFKTTGYLFSAKIEFI